MRRHLPLLLLLVLPLAAPAQHDPAMHGGHHHAAGAAEVPDTREWVRFPPAMTAHTLANMRDHLLALQQIQSALGEARYDDAAEIAEQRLGLSALRSHGAAESSRFMPAGMQEAGTAMHRSASRFGLAARDAAATGDLAPALRSLAQVTAACVSCHAAYRLQ
ncbi:hypothetical protein dqs_0472 [Azoarcus olearius]|uniref:hypothetical protein n=1 Tax=Azoarcus sp. (strain BH72) TaxID=418699 RepID=UPI00080629AA|nr:hypothetical protein [Azoarcus olearius]ANQ83548.1 hypothetical protein dqs_0472 [Azoarcus olearius]